MTYCILTPEHWPNRSWPITIVRIRSMSGVYAPVKFLNMRELITGIDDECYYFYETALLHLYTKERICRVGSYNLPVQKRVLQVLKYWCKSWLTL